MQKWRPVSFVVPPYILEEISKRGTPTQRAQAQKTLAISREIREERAVRGITAAAFVAAPQFKQRNVYDAKQGSQLPGVLVRAEGDPATPDVAVNEAYDGAGITYDLFYECYGRNSIDNNGMRMDSTVHYQRGYDNAFWNGTQMVYGDGDEDLPESERLFNRFTIALDIIGHELTHGVTQNEANLAYFGQTGALNESVSDVFAALVKQRTRGQTAAEADWIIGEGLFTSNVNAIGLRSMKAPGTAYDDPVIGKDPQPAHMRDYVNTIDDNGGVHINSGIPNRAFYITAVEIGGFAWDKAGLIWYKTLADKLGASSKFQDAANLTFQAAGELFGEGSPEQTAVRTGWDTVGITVGVPSQGGGCLTAVLRALGLAR